MSISVAARAAVARPAVSDLRLLPAAVAAWTGAAVAVAAPASAATVAIAIALWIAALSAVVLHLPGAWRGIVAITLAGGALVTSSVAAHATERSPELLREAAHAGRMVEFVVEVTGRAADGRIPVAVRTARVGGTAADLSTPVLVFGDRGDDVIREARIGERLRLSGTLSATEPGDDVSFLLFLRGHAVAAGAPPPLLAAADRVRADFRDAASGLPGDGAELLPGLAIGDTSSVGASLDDAMKVSSLSHLTAVSGANCAIVVGLALALGAAIGLPRLGRVAVAAVTLAGFVVLVTPEPSVLRAAVMAAVALLALAAGRPARGLPLLCVAVVVLLALDPWLARSYGFALSVLATAGLLLLARPIAEVIARVLPRGLALVLAVPIAAQLACQPVLLLLTPSLPLYGVVANLLAEPAAAPVTVLGLAACVVAPVFPPLATVLAAIAWVPASWIAAVAAFFAGLPGARAAWPTGAVGVALVIALTMAALGAALRGVPPPLRRIARAATAIALVGYLATLAGTRLVDSVTRPSDWQFAMCDVGQGDATVIRSQGMVALDDTGRDPKLLKACLDELGVSRIDLLVLTHYDLDHIGGVSAVYGKVARALIGPPSDAGDTRIANELRANGAEVDQVSRGAAGALGELRWDVLWPPSRGVEPGNPASVTLRLTPAGDCVQGCLSGILLGDLGELSQARLLGSTALEPVDVVKVAHHGSADQSARLYERLRATVGLIGVGADNDYGHPTSALLGILAAVGTRAERTDLDGLILIAPGAADGELRLWTQKGSTADAGSGG
ncbi:ComEC/Rec2 family competence protein [Lysinimonas soli]|uniref:ComEC/Rec2 family competence protein n=1 Tax=Lysinimonas soli TaxID=1074233 RepID=A0ABW0NPA9_9MICO